MLAHNLKDMLTLVPELMGHIKQANLEEDFPLDNKDGALASYMRCQFLTKVAKKIVNPEKVDLVKKAVNLYGVQAEARKLEESLDSALAMRKQAALNAALAFDAATTIANLEGQATGHVDLEKLASEAEAVFEKFPAEAAQSEVAKTYACKGFFHKEAAIRGLKSRAYATGNPIFEKVAEIVERSMGDVATEKDIKQVCQVVTALDKKAGLHLKGFNFYKEAQLFKSSAIKSALLVKLAGKNYPYESIQRFGKDRIGSILGKEVTAEMSDDPVLNKHVLESLPLDSQRVLANVIRAY